MTTTLIESLALDPSCESNEPCRILVASAGEADSLGAIHIASAIARRTGASVHALTVVTPFSHLESPPHAAAHRGGAKGDRRLTALEAVQRQLATVRGTGDWSVRVAEGWAIDTLTQAAEQWPASLLIVGLGDHGALLAATLLTPNGTLFLCHASMLIQDAPELGSLVDVYTAGAIDKLHEMRDRIRRQTKRTVECITAHGEVLEGLLAHMERQRCDLAMGGHDQGFVDNVLFGSVRARAPRHASYPVLVAPPRPSR